MIGWPAIVGSATKDGDTGVTVWSETPFVDMYLIGGMSNSADFTERDDCSNGCAYMANWNKVSQEFDQKWIFNEVQDLVDIKFETWQGVTKENYTFALVFSKQDGAESKNVVTFNKWRGQKATLGSTAYTLNDAYDPDTYEDFQNLTLMQNNRFHFVTNSPNKLESIDYFFSLTSEAKVTSIHTDVLNTANDENILFGIPTRKYMQGFGYDEDHVIQLATITIPRGDKELGGVVTLGQPQTYQVVVSRSITNIGTPLTFMDRLYGTKQTSGDEFYYYSHFAISQIVQTSGVSN